MFARKRVLAFLIVVLVASGFSMLFVWPEADEVQSIVHYENSILSFNNEEVGLLLLAVFAGLVGAALGQLLTLRATIRHDWEVEPEAIRPTVPREPIWFVINVVIGAPLGLLVAIVIKEGIVTSGSQSVSPFGLVAFASLAGLMGQAADRLLIQRDERRTVVATNEPVERPPVPSSPAVPAPQPAADVPVAAPSLNVKAPPREAATVIAIASSGATAAENDVSTESEETSDDGDRAPEEDGDGGGQPDAAQPRGPDGSAHARAPRLPGSTGFAAPDARSRLPSGSPTPPVP